MATSITNFGTLKTAVSTWMAETLSADVVDIVAFAQDYINSRLRHREMNTQTDLSPTSGVFTLPADYLQWRNVVELSTYRRKLTHVSKMSADARWPTSPSGLGCDFSIEGNSLTVYPTITNDIELSYYTRLAAFSSDSDTDWLLTKRPSVYLRACQMVASQLLHDDAAEDRHRAFVNDAIEELNDESLMSEFANTGIVQTSYAP